MGNLLILIKKLKTMFSIILLYDCDYFKFYVCIAIVASPKINTSIFIEIKTQTVVQNTHKDNTHLKKTSYKHINY